MDFFFFWENYKLWKCLEKNYVKHDRDGKYLRILKCSTSSLKKVLFFSFLLKLRVMASLKATQTNALTLCCWGLHCPDQDHLGPPTPPTGPRATFRVDSGPCWSSFACCGPLFAQPCLPLNPVCWCLSRLPLDLLLARVSLPVRMLLLCPFWLPPPHPLRSRCSWAGSPSLRAQGER